MIALQSSLPSEQQQTGPAKHGAGNRNGLGTVRAGNSTAVSFSYATVHGKRRCPGRSASWANDRAGQRGESDGGMQMTRNSMRVRGTNVVPPTNVVPKKFSDQDAAESFSAVVIGFTPRQLHKASGRTIEAAKGWLAGSRAPSMASVINMARTIPAVRAWLIAQSSDGHPESPESLDRAQRTLQQYIELRQQQGRD